MNILMRLFIRSGLVASISANFVQAAPLYYTFEGYTYGNGKDDVTAYREMTGISLGDPVSYVLFVDDQVSCGIQHGSHVDYGVSEERVNGGVIYHYTFYAELVAATGLIFNNNVLENVGSGRFGGTVTYSSSPSSQPYSNLNFVDQLSNGYINMYISPDVPQSNAGTYEDFSQWIAGASVHSGDNSLSLQDDEGNNYRYQNSLTLN